MGYWANPFDSKAGFEICTSLFEDLFVDHDTGDIIVDDVRKSVVNFETNLFGSYNTGGPGVTKLRVINQLYDEYRGDYAEDCGIYRCTNCNRVDHVFNWEFIDLATYPINEPPNAPPSTWAAPTADLGFAAGGLYAGGAYKIIAHIRCNEVSTCNACGLTFFAPISDIDDCPECGAGPADPSNDGLGMVQAGCGTIGSVVHAVAPIVDEQRCSLIMKWTSQSVNTSFIQLKRSKSLTVRIPIPASPTSYELTWKGDDARSFRALQGQAFKKRGEAMPWIPRLNVALPASQTSGSRTVSFPITMQGGYSRRGSPLHPGMFAFGGSTLMTNVHSTGVRSYLGGYRVPDLARYGDNDGRRSGMEVPGIAKTYRLGNVRIPIGSREGVSRRNRRYHTNILYMNPDNTGGGWNSPTWDVDTTSWDGNSALLNNISGSAAMGVYSNDKLFDRNAGRSGSRSAASVYNDLPVLRYRTFQNQAGQLINLYNPHKRDIDDHGMIRAQPIPIIPDRNLPGALIQPPQDSNELGGGSPACPNDMVAAIMEARKTIDQRDALAAAIVRTIGERISSSGSSASDYPFGITDIRSNQLIDQDPDLKQALIDLGIQIPSDAPGTGYSYIVGVNRARSAVSRGANNWSPVLRSSRGRPVTIPIDQLTPGWLSTADPSDYDEILFYAKTGGSGTRRDPSSFVPPRLVPRFGSVVNNREVVEDPHHAAQVELPPFFVKQTHEVVSVGKPTYDYSAMRVFQTYVCNTCLRTYSSGTIMIQHMNRGSIANLDVDPDNGIPVSWDYVPRNRSGLSDWMVAADLAFEGNRRFVTCPDPKPRGSVGLAPEPYYLAPGDSNDIEDLRYPQRMRYYLESELTAIPGYQSHDDTEVVVSGTSYPIPIPRQDFLLGSHNSRKKELGKDPNILSAASVGRLRSEANRPLYRRHDVAGKTLWIPVLWGVLSEGRMITTEATNLASISTILGGSP